MKTYESGQMPLVMLLKASHPLPSAAVTAGSALLAAAAGHHGPRLAVVVAAVLAGQLSIGWANDWIDAARDRVVGRADKPVATGEIAKSTVRTAAITAAVSTGLLSLSLGVVPGLVHLVAVAAGWLYNHPLKSTVASVLPYLIGFGLLPWFVVTALPGHPAPPWWLPVAGALLGGGAHFANALPDLTDDARTGIRGLPQRVGPAASRAITVWLLLAAGAVLVWGPGTPSLAGLATLAGSGLALGAVTAIGSEGALFRVVIGVALADVTLLLTSLF